MIDIHNHTLPGIDDGSRNLEESIDIFKEMSIFGITSVILTPHYIHKSDYNRTKKENTKLLKELKNSLKQNKININVYLGNEIFVDNNIYDVVDGGYISTMNDSKYVLLEFPMNHSVDARKIIYNLNNMGYKVILAHPERYCYYKFKDILELVQMGYLLQGNIPSFLGLYGFKCKFMFKRLLRHHAYTFLSTDMHSINFFDYGNINDIEKKLNKLVNYEYIHELLEENALKVIKNKDID